MLACYSDVSTLRSGLSLYGLSGWKPTVAQVLTARGLSLLLLLPLFWLRKVVSYCGRVYAEFGWGMVYAMQFPVVLGVLGLASFSGSLKGPAFLERVSPNAVLW